MMRALDLTGKKFGRLTAIEVVHVKGKRCWKCKCECGNEVIVPTFQLTSGNKKSCGCGRTKVNIGDRFGMLVVVEIIGYNKYGKRGERLQVRCLCDCGGEKITFTHYLTRGTTTHCGCKRIENYSKARRGKYGESLRNMVLNNYKRNAKNKGIPFELSNERVFELFQGNCHYCGDPPSKTIQRKKFYGTFTYNGIDRLDSSKGYVEGNVVSCCESCNYLKNAIPYNEFIEKITKIAKHLNLLKNEK